MTASKTLPPVHTNGHKPLLIFLGSSTPEKLRDFQVICEAKQLPIYFKDVRDLLDAFHSAEEKSGKYKGNADEKLNKVELKIRDLAKKHPEIIQKKCQEYGLEYDPAHTFFAADDTGQQLPRDIWDAMNKDGIDDQTLDKIGKNTTRISGGPGVETAPVISATLGAGRLMQRVMEAARKVGHNERSHIKIEEHNTLMLRSFSSPPGAPSLLFSGQASTYLHFQDPKRLTGRVSTYHFMRPGVQVEKSAAEMGEDYIAKHSARTLTIESLARHFNLKSKKGEPAQFQNPVSGFKIGMFAGAGKAHKQYDTIAECMRRLGANGRLAVNYPDALVEGTGQQAVLNGIEATLSQSDGILLLPGGGAEDADKFQKFYTLFSLIVAKQLIARDMQKPVIVINHDGSWDEAIANHQYLVNQGMTKDHSIAWADKVDNLPNGATIRSNAYFDEIKAEKEDDAYRAAILLLDKKRAHYMRRQPSEDQEFDGGTAPDKSRFNVAVFCSAGNENEKLNSQMRTLGRRLARNDYGIIYGGGDRYTMGAVLQGVIDHRNELGNKGMDPETLKQKAYIAGYSTAPILISETQHGQFSTALSYYKQTKDIYDRMASMLSASDAVVVAPGGAGTLQECVAALMLKKMQPEIFKQPIVVYNPALFKNPQENEKKVWDTALKSLLGKDYELLTQVSDDAEIRAQQAQRSKELGIYLASDINEVEKRLDSLRKSASQWQDLATSSKSNAKRSV